MSNLALDAVKVSSARQRLRSYIKKNRITLEELAKAGKVTENRLYTFFSGECVEIDTLERWAKKYPKMISYAFGLSFDKEDVITEEMLDIVPTELLLKSLARRLDIKI